MEQQRKSTGNEQRERVPSTECRATRADTVRSKVGSRSFVGLFFGVFVAALSCALPACTGPDGTGAHATVTVAPNDTPETACGGCHPKHVAEWRLSSHAYAMKDPVFQAMTRLGQRETQGALGDFCVKCHSPLGNATGQTAVFETDGGVFAQHTAGLAADAMGGVSCLVCHSISGITDTFNAGFQLSLDGVRRGPIKDPAKDAPHASVYSGLHTLSSICGTCHNVFNPSNVAVEETHTEWAQSFFNPVQSCQDCHMPKSNGPAAVGHAVRQVHEHTFVGVDVSLLPDEDFPGYDDLRDRATTLLQSSVNFSVAAVPEQRRLEVTVENLAGHALPSGATADREMWIELLVKDDSGKVVFESGTLDENGDLRVNEPSHTTRPGTDPELVLYTQELSFDMALADGGASNTRRVDFLWEPNVPPKNVLIPASAKSLSSYDLSSLPPGSYAVSARLLFRSFAPHLLRKLETLAALDPDVQKRVPTVEMATATLDVLLKRSPAWWTLPPAIASALRVGYPSLLVRG